MGGPVLVAMARNRHSFRQFASISPPTRPSALRSSLSGRRAWLAIGRKSHGSISLADRDRRRSRAHWFVGAAEAGCLTMIFLIGIMI